jgi:hypothetical protein
MLHFIENVPAESVTADSPDPVAVTVTFLSGMVLKEVTTPFTDLKSWALVPVPDKIKIKTTRGKVIIVFMAVTILSKDKKKKQSTQFPYPLIT